MLHAVPSGEASLRLWSARLDLIAVPAFHEVKA
ncbi:hypothetical protein [Actinophytocola gossypii]